MEKRVIASGVITESLPIGRMKVRRFILADDERGSGVVGLEGYRRERLSGQKKER